MISRLPCKDNMCMRWRGVCIDGENIYKPEGYMDIPNIVHTGKTLHMRIRRGYEYDKYGCPYFIRKNIPEPMSFIDFMNDMGMLLRSCWNEEKDYIVVDKVMKEDEDFFSVYVHYE